MSSANLKTTQSVVNAHVVSLRLLCAAWITHFHSLGYIKESTLDHLDKTVCKKTLQLTVRDEKTREAIGLSKNVWKDLVDVFVSAVPSLENRSFDAATLTSLECDGPSSTVIVANSGTLLKDLQRLDHLLAIARNVLTAGEKVQNTAAKSGFDREICHLITLCIRITARGYDGEASPVDEDKWQGVINGFKKLLITCLQFLSNLVTMNERLKLMLWVELFDTSLQTEEPSSDLQSEIKAVSNWVMNATKAFLHQTPDPPPLTPAIPSELDSSDRPIAALPAYFAWLKANRDVIKAEMASSGRAESRDISKEASRKWTNLTPSEKAPWIEQHQEFLAKFRHELELWQARGGSLNSDALPTVASKYLAQMTLQDSPAQIISNEEPTAHNKRLPMPSHFLPALENQLPNIPLLLNTENDVDSKMLETAADGARKLQEGKDQLLKRLESYPPDHVVEAAQQAKDINSPLQSPQSPVDAEHDHGDDDEEHDDEGESIEDDESSEEDFAVPGEDGRGLLTDIPLILGPNEIEVLPMIIMSGIVAPADASKVSSHDANAVVNMHTIRCHLLLAQENGRNLLRELLIFVAAWDLREEELYFKFMVKIMEAILTNGLMPFAYGAFKESKDIISPAQAVIMKLLTKIFHSRQGTAVSRGEYAVNPSQASKASPLQYPLKFDVQIVHCLFNEFRQNIIPQICALIFLQGQIRAGKAGPDDFPLNLWDMERMYEGVYQYLEFFAILTDHEVWKRMMAEWEMTSELITLLRELEVAIPKGRFPSGKAAEGNGGARPTEEAPAAPTTPNAPAPLVKPVAVERPFDVDAAIPPQSLPGDSSEPSNDDGTWEGPQDEPADFEWRNLKKLCVLVLSSLVWKNRKLQDQVRDFGGVMTILSCCKYDEHNPYIREHAIMCLRFLMENNLENQEIIRNLDAQQAVPKEVLDQHGYETFMDNKGQVGLRRKEGIVASRLPTPAPNPAHPKPPNTSDPATALPELMQMVMKSIPR